MKIKLGCRTGIAIAVVLLSSQTATAMAAGIIPECEDCCTPFKVAGYDPCSCFDDLGEE